MRSTNRFRAASTAGAVLASVLLAPLAAGATVGWIELEGAPLEKPDPFGWLMGPDAKPTLRDLIATFDEAAERPDIEGVVVRLREPALSAAQVQELGDAIGRVREAGKKVHLFTEIYGPAELLLGAFADEVIIQQGGAVSFPGLYMEEMFLADALGMIGVKADFVQIGDYKGASEQFANSKPSPAWDQNISQLLDSLYGAMRQIMKEGRGLDDKGLDTAMEQAWFASGEQAIALGLVDASIDRLNLDKHLEETYGEFEYDMDLGPDGAESPLASGNPFAIFSLLMQSPEHKITRSTIALLHIDGAIVDGESSEGGLFGGQGNVGSLTIRQALKQIEDEDKIKGVILRINSPGGSAIASESIWLGARAVAAKKPVWVSVGSMAASGGYYIAVAGERIYVNPSSIVGSIGVVGGKFALGGLYEMLKVNVVPRSRGPQADLFGSLQPWSEAQRSLVRLRMEETYHQFVDRVKAGRPGINISTTAEGRLFAGKKAIAMQMADEIGGVETAIRDMAEHLSLAEGAYDVVGYPAPKSLQDLVESMLRPFSAAAGIGGADSGGAGSGIPGGRLAQELAAALREVVGPRAWPALRDSMNAASQMRKEPVLLVTPRVMLFK